MRLELKTVVYFEHHGQIILKLCCTCTTDATSEGSMISSKFCRSRLIRAEPERAPNTRETGSGVYVIVTL